MNTFNEKLAAAAKKRRAKVLELRNKGLTLQAIGDKLGITRARVGQIVDRAKKDLDSP